MKVMSIIGIVWFSLSLIFVMVLIETNITAAAGWGILGLIYAIPFSIVGLVKSNIPTKSESSVTQELLNLFELKEKGILSEEEFQAMKIDLLKR